MIYILCKTASHEQGDDEYVCFLHRYVVTENNAINIEGYCSGSSNVSQLLCGHAFSSQAMRHTG